MKRPSTEMSLCFAGAASQVKPGGGEGIRKPSHPVLGIKQEGCLLA